MLPAAVLCAQEMKVHKHRAAVAIPVEGETTPGPNSAPKVEEPAAKPETPAAKPDEPAGKSSETAKSDETAKSVHRPAKPPAPPKPDELKARPDKSGKVRFSFNGQPWPGVLEWLAEISGMSLDWQELPGDYLNLTTQRSYTVAEARDLINRHLLARGFTLLRQGEVLTVANIKKLDPSLVPRLEPGELEGRDSHEFAKVSFPLVCLTAESAVDELKPMLSPNGKLTPLPETNRLEAMDAVANLRDIHEVLTEQQSAESQHRQLREFKLQYARASEVHEVLATLLGVESKPGASGMPQQPQNPEQAAMMMARMQQQQAGMPGQQPPGGATPKPKTAVSLAVNERHNSILVHARPDKMAVVAQVVEALDVPTDHNTSLLANTNRMQVYRLTGIDPEPVVKTLEEIGNLDPTTRLQVDKKNKSIIAYATLADHVAIRMVVDKLTGSERKFEVLQLRRSSADHVAGTIAFMMGVAMKKEKTRSNPWFSPFGEQPNREPAEHSKEFRVDADVEHNRLLLWANEVELGEIKNLLVKLGEIPAQGGNAETVRVIDAGDAKQAEELIERIRRAWPSAGPNALLVTPVGAKPAKETVDHGPTEDAPAPAAAPGPPPATAPADASPPPIRVSIGPDGKLILSSQDTQALDRLEDLATQLAPARKDYTVFHLKYASAIGVTLNLQDFFKDEKKDHNRQMPWWMMDYGNEQEDTSDDDDRRMSKRRKLKFIADSDTNSILVEGADPGQLKTIDDLVKLYDQAPPDDSQSVRKTETIHLQYSKAKVVADTIKDVYRDLLSANDKALANEQQGRTVQRNFTFSYSDSDKSEQKIPKFKGLLSIGVDEVSNTLAVSAPAYLFEHVTKMIRQLDEAAAPDYTVRVMKVGPGISADRLKSVLDDVYQNSSGKAPAAKAPPGAAPAKPAGKPDAKKNGTRAAGGRQGR